MTDCFNSKERSRVMSRIRSNGNYSTEVRFIQLMRKYKISGWRRKTKLLGRPDFVFTKCKLVVFIDGDFWHGNPEKFRVPKSNQDYWQQKIDGNKQRDRQVTKQLRHHGWRVIRFWESSLKDEEAIMGKLKLLL